jgi:hypothetical protein
VILIKKECGSLGNNMLQKKKKKGK